MRRDRLVVAGNGMVGWEFCRRAVDLGLHRDREIVVLAEEPRPAYDRIRLGECLTGRDPGELALAGADWYREHGIELRLGQPAQELDPERSRVRSADGWTGYASLVLATGSRPWLPPIPGAELPGVRTFRTVEDALAIAAACGPGNRAVVVGGGLLGLELAKGLADRGAEVVILERSPGLMLRQLNPMAAGILRQQVEGLGITVITEAAIEGILADAGGYSVRLVGRAPIAGDLVVVAAGIRPRDELARQAGIVCSPSGGVVVDERLRTSAPGISAIGECACVGTTVYGLAAPGFAMAEVLARRLAGDDQARFAGADLATRLKLAGLDVATFGDYLADGAVTSWRQGSAYRQVVVRDGRFVGATVIGAWDEQPALADAVARRLPADARRLQDFPDGGSLFAGAAGVAAWPASAVVCSCRRVTRGELGACLARCPSVAALGAATGAGTVCGSCRPLLAVLAGSDPAAEAPPRATPVVVAASAAALAFAGFALLWSWPRAVSWAQLGPFEHVWRDGFLRQASGWTVLGLCFASIVLAARKRIPRLTWGDVGWWRLAHVLLAGLGVAGLIVHNGLRLGHGQDRTMAGLMLAGVALGGLAGLALGWERLAESPAVRLARIWSLRLHLAALALAAPLLAMHVYKVLAY